MKALSSHSYFSQSFLETLFRFSNLDIFKNVHFQNPHRLFKFFVYFNQYIKKLLIYRLKYLSINLASNLDYTFKYIVKIYNIIIIRI